MTDDAGSGLVRWGVVDTKVAADCRVFRVLKKTCHHPGRDATGEFYVLGAPDWVNVVALTSTGELVMVRQFRFGVEGFSLEVPGGVMEAGEDPVDTARRELREETGFVGGEARLMLSVHPNPAIQANQCHLVMIRGVEKAEDVAWDQHEEIEVSLIPPDEALCLARSGGITHALALNALWMFDAERRRGSCGV